MAYVPSDVRAVINATPGFPVGRAMLLVVPGAGPLYALIKQLPSASQQMAGLSSVIHGLIPQMVGLPGSPPASRSPMMARFRITGRDDVEEQGHSSMQVDDIHQLWDDLGEAFERAQPLPVDAYDDLEHWALFHDAALSRLKSGNFPGSRQTLEEAPALHAHVMERVDGYHARLVVALEQSLHAQDPGLYPAEPGWLGIPSGVEAPSLGMVPVRRLLRSAPEQAQAQALRDDCELEYSLFSMDV